jgi:hypothetical protein
MLWQEGYGKGSWFGGYKPESLVGRDQYDGEMIWSRQDINGEVFMLHQSMREFQISSCETGHISVG